MVRLHCKERLLSLDNEDAQMNSIYLSVSGGGQPLWATNAYVHPVHA